MKVEHTTLIAADPERVWQAWIYEINRWWTAPYYNDASRVSGLEFEPHLGGHFIEKWGEGGSGFLIGHIVEWLPPQRLAYTWSERTWGGIVTLVSLEFQPEDQNTRLSIVHSGFERLPEGEKLRLGYADGHGKLMSGLKNYLERV